MLENDADCLKWLRSFKAEYKHTGKLGCPKIRFSFSCFNGVIERHDLNQL